MKNYILTLTAITIISFSACKKDENTILINKADEITKTETGTTTKTETLTGTYQPMSEGSNWTYHNDYLVTDQPGQPFSDTTVNTMTGITKIFNGKTYQLLSSVTGKETEDIYYGFSNHNYYNYDAGVSIELPYLNEKTALNEMWISPINVQDSNESQLKGSIVEKNIDKVVRGTLFHNVIHSELHVQTKVGGKFTTVMTFDFYIAKNIGIIATYITEADKVVSKSELIHYSINNEANPAY